MKGYVYILLNPAFPKYLKIGKTYRSVKERADELSAHTGLPSPFYIRHVQESHDCDVVEALVHQALEGRRVNAGREFFEISLDSASEIVTKAEEIVRTKESN